MSGQPFTIIRDDGRKCIRVMIGGTRQRVYLDQIEWLADLREIGGVDPLSTTTVRSMGDVAYRAKEADLPLPSPTEVTELARGEIGWVDPLELDWHRSHSAG